MKPIPFHDFAARWETHRARVLAAVERVGASGRWILGTEVAHFERELAPLFGQRFAVGCASGMDALELSLRCAGLQRGQRVLTTPLSAFATTLAIVRAGGVPVFCDVDASGQLDLALARALFEEHDDLRVLVPVHLYGLTLDLDALRAVRDDFDLTIVEDCAQAIGATSHGHRTGSVGRFAATSFYPTKNLGAMGDAGAVLTSDEEAAQRIASLRNYGQVEKGDHRELGLNSRLDELQAALMRDAFLPELPNATTRRREIARAYRERLKNDALTLPPVPPECAPCWHLFPLLVAEGRDPFRSHLERSGVGTEIHYPRLIPEQLAMRDPKLGDTLGELPRAAAFAASEVSLPLRPDLRDEEVEQVIDACNAWDP